MNILGLIDWPWWTSYAFWGGVALVALIALGAVKQIAGWPGVVAVLLAVVAIVSAAVGFKQGEAWAERRKPKGKDGGTLDLGGLFGGIFRPKK